MNAIIDELTPAQRALLHTALQNFKEQVDTAFASVIINGSENMQKEFLQFAKEEIRNLQNKLFAECFIEDMDFVEYFNKQYQAKKEIEQQSIGKKEIQV